MERGLVVAEVAPVVVEAPDTKMSLLPAVDATAEQVIVVAELLDGRLMLLKLILKLIDEFIVGRIDSADAVLVQLFKLFFRRFEVVVLRLHFVDEIGFALDLNIGCQEQLDSWVVLKALLC